MVILFWRLDGRTTGAKGGPNITRQFRWFDNRCARVVYKSHAAVEHQSGHVQSADIGQEERWPFLVCDDRAEVIRQCDQLDGVKDDIVSHPDLCDFTLTPLMCHSGGAKSAACLTTEQAETVKNFYRDYFAEGRLASPGLELGSESQWSVFLSGPAPSSSGDAYIQYFLFDDPSWH